jgi:hypothetical protein
MPESSQMTNNPRGNRGGTVDRHRTMRGPFFVRGTRHRADKKKIIKIKKEKKNTHRSKST